MEGELHDSTEIVNTSESESLAIFTRQLMQSLLANQAIPDGRLNNSILLLI